MIEIREKYTDVLLQRVQGEALAGADLQGLELWSANFRSCDLRRARLARVELPMSTLQGADLRHADLHGADLRYADMRKTRLQGTNLAGASLTGTDFTSAWYDAATRWPAGFDPGAGGAREVPVSTARGEVLLVEDQEPLRDLLRKVLYREGFAVHEAPDGAAAMDYLRRHVPPDVILLDLMMPAMNGWVFRLELNRDAALCAIPVVVLSGHDEAGDAADRLGAAAFLPKPYDRTRLVQTLNTFCG